MSRHIIMDASGHSTIEFDDSNAADLAAAEARFRRLLRKGFIPATADDQGRYRVHRSGVFDPRVQETIFIPRLKGG